MYIQYFMCYPSFQISRAKLFRTHCIYSVENVYICKKLYKMYIFVIFCQMLLDETRSKLGHVTDDKAKYKSVLEGLITQVFSFLL